jgi:hypothetical protein
MARAAAGSPLESEAITWWLSERLNTKLRQAPFAHHRGQVVEVGYGPQRMSISSWSGLWWNIRCVNLGGQQHHLLA